MGWNIGNCSGGSLLKVAQAVDPGHQRQPGDRPLAAGTAGWLILQPSIAAGTHELACAQPERSCKLKRTAALAKLLAIGSLVLLLAALQLGTHDAAGSEAENAAAAADPLRVLPEGKLPEDQRLGPLKTLNDYFPFEPCASPAQWAQRTERLRRQIMVAAGLWPMPTRIPLRAVIHGPVERPEYTVEKVYFESLPGHYVTGNLYRPKAGSGPRPAVLCPHGHWSGGRFHDAGEQAVKREIKQGAERFALGGRHPIQARCVQLARMGCVVFNYDMLGYADSVQLNHRPGVREEMNTPRDWGFFSPQAELRLQNMLGLQTFNSIRALDFVGSLPDVDPQRIGVTGASGGGTQTFLLCAVDRRPAAAFPAVMVSTAMQGGCTCENACYLRIGTGNVEIAALFAPKPLGLTAANDWTREMPEKGFPQLKAHYRLLGAEKNVSLTALLQFGHNYNYPSRAAMYAWMNQHLGLGCPEPIVEQDYQPLLREEMSVWDADHPAPPGGPDHERALLRWLSQDAEHQIRALRPRDEPSLAEYRGVVGGAVEVMIGRGVPAAGEVRFRRASDGPEMLDGCRLLRGLVDYPAGKEQVPVAILLPAEPAAYRGEAVVWIDAQGKRALLGPDGRLRPTVRRMVAAGRVVVGVDLFGQGEFTPDGKPLSHTRLNGRTPGGPMPYAGYTFGYNHPLFAQRVHDILSVVAVLRSGPEELAAARTVSVVGLRGAGHWVAGARAVAGSAIDRAAVDTAGFRFARVTEFDDPDFLPGGAKYDDLPGMLALGAPGELWLAGERGEGLELVEAAYRAAGAAERLSVFAAKEAGENVAAAEQAAENAALEWLLETSSSRK